jgi:hypothetical protein
MAGAALSITLTPFEKLPTMNVQRAASRRFAARFLFLVSSEEQG